MFSGDAPHAENGFIIMFKYKIIKTLRDPIKAGFKIISTSEAFHIRMVKIEFSFIGF